MKKQSQRWTRAEDNKLMRIVSRCNPEEINWKIVANKMSGRSSRQCLERWKQYLRPNINTDPFTSEEDELLEKLVEKCGTKWVSFREYFKGRSDVALRNRHRLLQRHKKRDQKFDSVLKNLNELVQNVAQEAIKKAQVEMIRKNYEEAKIKKHYEEAEKNKKEEETKKVQEEVKVEENEEDNEFWEEENLFEADFDF